MTIAEANALLEEHLKHETKYLKENDFVTNPHGVYLYVSADGFHRLSLDGVLNDYKQWLIDNRIVKELQP
jgi:hypothetical protein